MRVLQLLLDIKFVNWDEKVLHDGSTLHEWDALSMERH